MPKYPGLGLPLRYQDKTVARPLYPIGADDSRYRGALSDPLPVREVAMMDIMERLTDKEDWQKKVFDEHIVSKWRDEALAIPQEDFWNLATSEKVQDWEEDGSIEAQRDIYCDRLEPSRDIMTEAVFNCCLQELRSKAAYYEKSGIIPTLDACASVAKSDKLVTPKLHEELREAFAMLQRDQAPAPDWHPDSKNMVQDLVHPSMYPLVYGRSKVLEEEEVGVKDAIDKWAGKGSVIEKDNRRPYDQGVRRADPGDHILPWYWSNTYQWLPANVSFQANNTVKFTSYINNLHPIKYAKVYCAIEKLIAASLPAWDQCLTLVEGFGGKDGAGRQSSRFSSVMPEDRGDNNPDIWIPSDAQDAAMAEVDWNELAEQGKYVYNPKWDDEIDCKWKAVRQAKIPEPVFESVEYAPDASKCLVERFSRSGLQVIVKIASIELTPEKPEFPIGRWHVEGQINEHICATSLYYLDSENITSSNLSFRMLTSHYTHYDDRYDVGQNGYNWLERILGVSLNSSPCLQNYGSVETRDGRLLAFPNVFQHRVSPFRLVDPTKPGHRRFIALWLVDPNCRIISTANVPPQQRDWWLDSVFGSAPETRSASMSRLPPEIISLIEDEQKDVADLDNDGHYSEGVEGKLPLELMEMVRGYFNEGNDAWLMGLDEAKEHRLKLTEERRELVEISGANWQNHRYHFHEH